MKYHSYNENKKDIRCKKTTKKLTLSCGRNIPKRAIRRWGIKPSFFLILCVLRSSLRIWAANSVSDFCLSIRLSHRLHMKQAPLSVCVSKCFSSWADPAHFTGRKYPRTNSQNVYSQQIYTPWREPHDQQKLLPILLLKLMSDSKKGTILPSKAQNNDQSGLK